MWNETFPIIILNTDTYEVFVKWKWGIPNPKLCWPDQDTYLLTYCFPTPCLNKICWWKMVYWKMSTHYFCGIKYHTTNGNGVSIQNPKYWYLEGAKHWVWPSCLYGLTFIITLCPFKLVDFVTGGLIWHKPTIVQCVWAYLFIILFFI